MADGCGIEGKRKGLGVVKIYRWKVICAMLGIAVDLPDIPSEYLLGAGGDRDSRTRTK